MRTEIIEEVKEVIKENIRYAGCGIFDTPSLLNDIREEIYHRDNVSVLICKDYQYFEVYGLTDEEFNDVKGYYYSINKQITTLLLR